MKKSGGQFDKPLDFVGKTKEFFSLQIDFNR